MFPWRSYVFIDCCLAVVKVGCETNIVSPPGYRTTVSLSRALGFCERQREWERGSPVLYHSAWPVPLFYRSELTRRMPLTKLFSINCYCPFALLYRKTRSLEIIGFMEILGRTEMGQWLVCWYYFNGWEGLKVRMKRKIYRL